MSSIKKITMDDIYEHVTKNGFYVNQGALGDADYGTDFFSAGILFACYRDGEWDEEFIQQTSEAARRFYSGDWGNAVKYYDIIPGCEHGCYPSKYDAIWIKREASSGLTVMYFFFER